MLSGHLASCKKETIKLLVLEAYDKTSETDC